MLLQENLLALKWHLYIEILHQNVSLFPIIPSYQISSDFLYHALLNIYAIHAIANHSSLAR